MKKRILFSYVIAFSLLLANISFAGYTTPVQEFFGDNGYGVVSETVGDTVIPEHNLEPSVVTRATHLEYPQEIVHEDKIELFQDTTAQEDIHTDDSEQISVEEKEEINDFVHALEQELAS